MTPAHFARQIKGRPKTDKRDCQWIQRLHKLGMLPPIFQPDESTQTLRDYVRQRANLIRVSSQHIQRMQKALQLMNLKLTKVLGDVTGVTGLRSDKISTTILVPLVLGDVTGVTGLRIIRAILKGQRAPQELAKLRDCRCRHSAAEIAEALDGRYRPEHVLELRNCLFLWEQYQQVVAELDVVIAAQLRSMQRDTALPPRPRPRYRRRHEVQSSKTRRGKGRASGALRLAAWSLMRSKSYLGAYLRRQRSRLGAAKAITATAHKLARIVYNLMRYGVEYMKQTEAAYAEQVHQRLEKQLRRRAKELGYELTKIEPPVTPTVQQ